MINISNLSKTYGTQQVLNGLSLEIPTGETVALLGGNGAGKSTLIKILSGLISYDSGEINLEGTPYQAFFQQVANKAKIGIVPQETALYATLSVAQNLSFWGRLYGLSQSDINSRIRYYLGMLELEGLKDKKVENLSIGQQKIISLLSGILHDPILLFLDEPTVGIDILHKEKIYAFIRALKAKGITIIYTTHNFSEIPKICDQIAILKGGIINDYGTEQELIAKYNLDHSVEIQTEQLFYNSTDLPLHRFSTQGIEVQLKKANLIGLYGQKSGLLLPEIIRALHDQQIKITHLQINQPTLENIFIEAHN